jgi:thiamine biosynthesis lipoprotein
MERHAAPAAPDAVSRRALFSRRAAARPAGAWMHVSRPAMACRFEIAIPADLPHGVAAAAAALDEVDRIEDRLSVFRDESEVSRLNRCAHGAPFECSPSLAALLQACARLHRDTHGAFDPTSGPLTRCWGFFRRAGCLPRPEALAEARDAVGMAHVRLAAGCGAVRFARSGVELNFGSIGKGYALDCAARTMLEHGVGTALLSAGGSSVLALGSGTGEWRVGLRDPRRRDRRWAVLHLEDAALATSGSGEQFFEHDGRRYGHVLDPRTGWPVDGRLAVTVVASNAADADALSTAFFVGGLELARDYCERHDNVLALVHESDGASPAVVGRHAGCRVEACGA